VIREAVRSLSAHGLVESHPGRGMVVATVGPEAVNRLMTLYLRGNATIDYAKVHEVRSALEVEMTGTAARRAREDDLARLRELLAQLRDAGADAERAAEVDVEFHRAIAAATQNQLFGVMLDAVADVLRGSREAAFAAPGMLDYAVEAHSAILKAIEAHDEEAATGAMRAHLEHAREVWASANRE
jgi:GntR family transcriptional repressor for pyruvate dehydrogenase complex